MSPVMLLDVSRLAEGRARIDHRYRPGDFDTRREEFALADEVHLTADVHKQNERVRLTGRVQGALSLTCSRCVEAFHAPVDAEFDVIYLPQAENAGEGEVEIQDEDLAIGFYREQTIDLRQLMREQFYLALPMKPLCRENCLGLCPVCGINRNTGTCDCVYDWEDPRLAPLRALKKKESE